MFSEENHKYDGRRDRKAFEEAALPLMDYLYSKALKLTRNPNDAEDLVQDTYAIGLRKFHMYEPGTNLKAWLSRIQFNYFISQYRRKKKRPDGANIAGMEEIVRDRDYVDFDPELLHKDPVELLNDEAFMDRLPRELRDGLIELDERYRDVLLMNVIGQKSYKDIAESLKVPVGTVMSRLSRAKAALRTYFGGSSAFA